MFTILLLTEGADPYHKEITTKSWMESVACDGMESPQVYGITQRVYESVSRLGTELICECDPARLAVLGKELRGKDYVNEKSKEGRMNAGTAG